MSDLIDKLKNVRAMDWALVACGAAFGGAVLHQSRLLGGVIVGGLALAYAVSQAPCCDGCAKGEGCADAVRPVAVAVASPELLGHGGISTSQQSSTQFGVNDYVGTSPPSSIDPLSVWSGPTYTNSPSDNAPKSASSCESCS